MSASTPGSSPGAVAFYRLYTERVALMEGFEGVVGTLRERGSAVALVSSSPHRWIDYVLNRFGIRGAFDAVVSVEAVPGPGKPAPDVYEAAADRLGVDPDSCVAIEDSTHGVDAAVDAGMACLGYRTDANRDADLSTATVTIQGAARLRSWVEART